MTKLALELSLPAVSSWKGGGGSGASAASDMLKNETDGIAFSSADDSMRIKDTVTPANNYDGSAIYKWGSVRASAGVDYGSNSFLTWGPENLALQSEALGTAPWAVYGSTVTANTVAGPFGSALVADEVNEDAANGSHNIYQYVTQAANTVYTVSGYLKSKNRTFGGFSVIQGDGFSSGGGAIFDLTTGALAKVSGTEVLATTCVPAANGYWRCSMTYLNATAGASGYIEVTPCNDGDPFFLGAEPIYQGVAGNGIYAFGIMWGRGTVAHPYLSTVASATYGLRRDYDPRAGGASLYLCEEARTNLCLSSEVFNTAPNTPWGTLDNMLAFGAGSVANATVAPDGNTTADLLVPNTTVGFHRIYQTATQAAGTYTHSIFVKPAGYTKVSLREDQVSGGYAAFNLSGAGSVIEVVPAALTATSAAVIALANGWYRISFTFTSAGLSRIGIIILSNSYTTGSPLTATYAGDGTSGQYLWGAQVEAGANASSYIPTTTATVTRAVDWPNFNKNTGFNWSGTAATIYAKSVVAHAVANNAQRLSLDLGYNVSASHEINVGYRNSDAIMGVSAGNITQASWTAVGELVPLTYDKMAVASQLNNMNAAINGVLQVLDTTGTQPASGASTTVLQVGCAATGSFNLNGWVAEGMHLPRRMTDPEITVLTA